MDSRDIRVLTLYKQHYLDQYKVPLKCEYSCWGYYDGIDIGSVQKIKSKLFDKNEMLPISGLWYHGVEKARELNGGFGEQNIGLLRCVAESDDTAGRKFWDEHERMPYFAVAFLQLYEKERYAEIGKMLEAEFQSEQDELQQYGLLSYCTFDNADLVLLMQSSSLSQIETMVQKIEENKKVAYVHPITGVSEQFLQDGAPGLWHEIDCHLGEEIAQINVSIVSSGNKFIKPWIKTQLLEVFDESKITYSVTLDHANLLIRIAGTTVQEFLNLLKAEGFSTHQNVLYENGVYNIETSIYMHEAKISSITSQNVPQKRMEHIDGWCAAMIEKCREDFENWLVNGNESMYSYYQALIQTLNTLGQYEKFDLASNMFYQLYPSFKMFFRQLKEAMNKAMSENDSEMMEKIKDSICQYLESVNSVMYHTTHTDQLFLMIPGYSGTTFAIPSKLSLLYSWLCGKVIDILNDSSKPYEYRCLLTPVMEAKPVTSLISFGLDHGNRLVCVRLSQRSLYMPRDLMIILTHEAAHYVGDEIRLRRYRASELVRALAVLLTEGIIPGKDFEKSKIYALYDWYNRAAIQKKIIYFLMEKLKKNCRDKEYHASYMEAALVSGCREILADDEGGVRNTIYKVPEEIEKYISGNEEDCRANVKELYELQKKCDNNRIQLLASSEMEQIIRELIKMCREVFSDVAALAILNFDLDTFQEAFDVSEGIFNEEKYDERQSARKEVMQSLMKTGKNNLSNGIEIGDTADLREADEDVSHYLLYNLFAFDATKNLLRRYAEKCYEVIKTRAVKKKEEVYAVRKVYSLFSGEKEHMCGEIFQGVFERIKEYQEDVMKSYRKTK